MEINLLCKFSSHSVSAADSVLYMYFFLQLTPFLNSTIGIQLELCQLLQLHQLQSIQPEFDGHGGPAP